MQRGLKATDKSELICAMLWFFSENVSQLSYLPQTPTPLQSEKPHGLMGPFYRSTLTEESIVRPLVMAGSRSINEQAWYIK